MGHLNILSLNTILINSLPGKDMDIIIWNHQQITFVTLNRFCSLSKTPPPVVNRQYEAEWRYQAEFLPTKIK